VLAAAVLEDGTVFWSSDWIGGGPPYFTGRVIPDQLHVLRGHAAELILDEDRCTLMSDTPPDALYMTIYASIGARTVEVSSCRELVESNPRLICTDHGIEPLGDRSRQAMEAERSEAYRKCLARWDAIRRAIHDLLPARGEAVAELPDNIRQVLGITDESDRPEDSPQPAPRRYN
jgi:hypothetical protein